MTESRKSTSDHRSMRKFFDDVKSAGNCGKQAAWYVEYKNADEAYRLAVLAGSFANRAIEAWNA